MCHLSDRGESAGEEAWESFQEAADESLAKGLTSKDYW